MTYDLLMLMFDDPHAEEVERYLTSKQIKVVREHTVKKAIQCIRYNSYHFVLLDQRLEGADFLMDIVYQGYYGIYTYCAVSAGDLCRAHMFGPIYLRKRMESPLHPFRHQHPRLHLRTPETLGQ